MKRYTAYLWLLFAYIWLLAAIVFVALWLSDQAGAQSPTDPYPYPVPYSTPQPDDYDCVERIEFFCIGGCGTIETAEISSLPDEFQHFRFCQVVFTRTDGARYNVGGGDVYCLAASELGMIGGYRVDGLCEPLMVIYRAAPAPELAEVRIYIRAAGPFAIPVWSAP